jgi:predicted nucleic acid-binding Zn ribbon protein
MRIELNCAECGNNRFTIVRGMEDDAVVRCSDCGHQIGTMGELKARVAAEVMRRAARPSSDAAK